MPSPFPGMNPYLEHPFVWPDFQRAFVVACCASLTAQLPPGYFVLLDHDRYGGTPKEQDESPCDIPVVVQAGNPVRAPMTVTIPAFDGFRVPFITIRDVRFKDLLAVIHVIGLESKEAEGRESYLQKWDNLLHGPIHFVEIDLLRGGQPTPWGHRPPGDYSVTVSRWEARPTAADRWPIQLRERLPIIPVPLRDDNPEPTLDLQALLHKVYDAAGYRSRLYRRQPDPPLSADDRAWADALLTAERGSRTQP